ncbi:MAG: DUF5995 family protein [Actinomycetia bacterium]|nr:DUF5995 family protein [Actinomycetes bacterium]
MNMESHSERGLDDVIVDLDTIIDRAIDDRSELGIFPAMYRVVTVGVRDAVRVGFFDHNDAMAQLSVVFADRYLDAYDAMRHDRPLTESWQVAFAAAMDGQRRMVVQHLMSGMTAHINLDLGIATARVAANDPDSMYVDFFRVNQMLYEQLNGFQQMLNSVSSRMGWLDTIGGTLDERLAKIGIGGARERAWRLALNLINNPDRSDEIISARDHETAHLEGLILEGVVRIRTVSWFIASTEPSDVRVVINAFLEPSVDLDVIAAAVESADTTPPSYN